MDTVIAAPASCEVRAVIRFLYAEGQSVAALSYAAKMYEGTLTARTEVPCYY